MPAILVDLGPGVAVFIVTEQDYPSPIVFTAVHLQQVSGHILKELKGKFGQHKVRMLAVGEPPYPYSGRVDSAIHKISRNPNGFADSFKHEIKVLIEELSATDPGDGVLVLETGYSVEKSFAADNIWADSLYVYGRVLKKAG